jgi:hypothetical protein
MKTTQDSLPTPLSSVALRSPPCLFLIHRTFRRRKTGTSWSFWVPNMRPTTLTSKKGSSLPKCNSFETSMPGASGFSESVLGARPCVAPLAAVSKKLPRAKSVGSSLPRRRTRLFHRVPGLSFISTAVPCRMGLSRGLTRIAQFKLFQLAATWGPNFIRRSMRANCACGCQPTVTMSER